LITIRMNFSTLTCFRVANEWIFDGTFSIHTYEKGLIVLNAFCIRFIKENILERLRMKGVR